MKCVTLSPLRRNILRILHLIRRKLMKLKEEDKQECNDQHKGSNVPAELVLDAEEIGSEIKG